VAVQIPIAAVLFWAISASLLAPAVLPLDRSPLMIGMLTVLAAATSALAYSRSMLIGLQQIVSANWRGLWGAAAAVSILLAGLAVNGLLHNEPTPQLVLGLTVAGAILSCVVMIQALLWMNLSREGGSGLRSVLGFGSLIYVCNLVQFLNYRLDLFLVSAIVGTREVGLYVLAVGLSQLLWIASGSVAVALLPRVAAGSSTEGAADTARLTRITLAIGVVGAVALALVVSPLVQIVYGQAYEASVIMLLMLLPGAVAFIAVNVLAAYIAGLGRVQINLVVSLIGLCATLPLCFILIPRLGAVGAAIASSVSYSLSAIITVCWTMKSTGLPARKFLLIQRADLVVVRNALWRLVR
jgi:O-antigen/teichoic acid export membrane protein